MNVDVPPGPQERFIVTRMGGDIIGPGVRLRSYDRDGTEHTGTVQNDGTFTWDEQ